LVLFLSITGCGGSPERNPNPWGGRLPSRWAAASVPVEPVRDHWLSAFGDPKLTALVSEALANNFDLKAAAARVEIFRAQARIDGAGRWPQLFFAAGYQREKVRDSGFGSTEFGAFEGLFDLAWELDVWGRIRASQQAAWQDAEAASADFRGARLSLAARTAQTYFELAEARLQAEAAEQSVRERGIVVELVKGRFARGLTRGLDLRLAMTDLANAEAQLAEARNQVQIVKRRLEVLLGRYPAGTLAEASNLPEPPSRLPTGVPSGVLERRPDLNAAFERLRAADSRVESAQKALLPRVALTAAGGTRSAALAELVDPRAAVWNLALGLLQPIFTGGRLKGEIKLNEARVREAFNQYQSVALGAFREVEQALAAEERLREQERALREAVEQTRESRKLAVHSYRHGFIEILTLLDSYRSTLNAQSAHLAVKRRLLSNRIDLYLALGGEV
jgi:multidrug efflux system outer membrane protein